MQLLPAGVHSLEREVPGRRGRPPERPTRHQVRGRPPDLGNTEEDAEDDAVGRAVRFAGAHLVEVLSGSVDEGEGAAAALGILAHLEAYLRLHIEEEDDVSGLLKPLQEWVVYAIQARMAAQTGQWPAGGGQAWGGLAGAGPGAAWQDE